MGVVEVYRIEISRYLTEKTKTLWLNDVRNEDFLKF